jgi:hypothetical protein
MGVELHAGKVGAHARKEKREEGNKKKDDENKVEE